MIKDTLRYIDKYRTLHPAMATVIQFLARTDLAGLAAGRHTIDGDAVFAMVSASETRAMGENCKWEAHRQYIDVQCIVSGRERISYANIDRLQVTVPYDSAGDVLFLDGESDEELVLQTGDFAVFWPEDAHRPGLAVEHPEPVKKVVVKVRL